MQKSAKQVRSIVDSRSPIVRGVLDHLPCAVAVWANDLMRGSLNRHAMQLLGIADCDLRYTRWISQVDPRDRNRFSSSMERLKNQGEAVCTDYRFLRSAGKSIWLRDVSAVYLNVRGEPEAIISAYTDISDLKTRSSKPKPWNQETLEGVIGPVIHEIRNNLHAIRLEIDLLLMDFGAALNSDRFFDSVDRVNRSLHDLREYLVCPEPDPCAANPKLLLNDVIGEMRQELEQRRIKVELNQPTVLPLVWIDSKQFRSALERVIEFCRVLLDHGGELKIETGAKKVDATDYLELTLTTTSVSSFDVDEKDIFRPFLKVNNRQIGLGMALARQILRRNRGNISFLKETPRRGRISILLKPCVQ